METELRARELENEYRSFLDDEARSGIYKAKVEHMINKEQQRLLVNINDIRRDPSIKQRAQGLIENSVEELISFQRALKDYVVSLNPAYGRSRFEFFIGLNGSFGSRHVTPRTLTSRFLNNTICVEGIVSKVSLVRPKILKSVHHCPITRKTVERRHYDLSSLEYQPSSSVMPTKDDNGNPLEIEYGLCLYKDHQTLTLQEMPEMAPAGQLPRTVDIILENDLVDTCKPGDRVQIVGSYRCLPNKQGNFSNCVFRTVVLGNYVEQLSKEVSMTLTEEDVKACKRLSRARRFNIFERLAESLAPSIYGHANVKKAILCMLLGGVEKHLKNGTRLRGDINILLIGDPSVAKSQLLRFVLGCAPRAIATTGRGSSGVGLTAAVTTDPETGDRRLEAGAMVLADRGIVCVDEFDKMSDIDRTAIHEVMEQGRVTICKAGIQARLNARCSVLAAANPVSGNYDLSKEPMENIAMQDSLLSRFDLLFIMLDEHNRQNDSKISEHVVRIHRYRPQNELDGEPTVIHTNASYLSTLQGDKNEDEQTEIFERHNPLLHGNESSREKYFTIDFMRKYIHIAKLVKPTLTEEACLMIGEHYSILRRLDVGIEGIAKTGPITARTLETMIRLATAHAKARLSTKIESEDAAAAISLVQYSCYHKVLTKPKVSRKRKKDAEDGEDSGVSEAEDEHVDNDGQPAKRKRVDGQASDEHADEAMDQDKADEEPTDRVVQMTDEERAALKEKLPAFERVLNDISRKAHGASILDLDQVSSQAEKELKLQRREVDILLLLMMEKEYIMLDGTSIYII
ncbi:Zygotic DNA replication licensing factor mcm3, partial [Fragariocoptes setiger]